MLFNTLSIKSLVLNAFCIALASGGVLPAIAATGDTWRIDPDKSSINFAVKNMGLTVKGKFAQVAGTVKYDGKNLSAASVKSEIVTSSIKTGIGPRDHHLKSGDFFNAGKFPDIQFQSNKIIANDSGAFDIVGVLNMHGVSEEVTLHARPLSQPTAGRMHTYATAQLNRKDFSIGGFAAASVSNNVDIQMHIDLVSE